MKRAEKLRARRQQRVRRQIGARASGRPRLSVFRSNRYIYAQVIDDLRGTTLAAASSLEKGVESGANCKAASEVGKLVATRAREVGISDVVFDRGPYIFHGRVRALAEAPREGGLNF